MAKRSQGFKNLFWSLFLRAKMPRIFSTKEGALQGYDLVCYFKIGRHEKGKVDCAHAYGGAIWHFMSAENLSTFKANPSQFVPQFGGYCSFDMASGYKGAPQPDAWTIIKGKLYLNYDLTYRSKWNQKQEEYILKANKNWAMAKPQ